MNDKTYIHYGAKKFDRELFTPIKKAMPDKPSGGLWASPVDSEYSWIDYAHAVGIRNYTEENSFIFCLSKNSKVLVIDSLKDLDLCPRIECPEELTNIMYWFDFEKIAQDYDAIALTNRGLKLTKHSWPMSFLSWDCESILIMNQAIIMEIERCKT